ncbi:hypothetical protein C8J56DRAFT_472398 [Mycena floridula]|nr:hypothetical protein C8J56DRAFT_472398 [Mycena floridula]
MSSRTAPKISQARCSWNAASEKKIDKIFGTAVPFKAPPGRRPLPSILDGFPDFLYRKLAEDDATVQNTHVIAKQICTLQRDLSKKVSRRFAEDDFVGEWKRCTAKDREAWMLEGLQRTCNASPDFEEWRTWCPETTIVRCNYESGQGFLDLIGQLVGQDLVNVPADYRIVPNTVFDTMNKQTATDKPETHPGRRMLQRSNNNRRIYFLTMFVWTTLLAFYGESETYGLQKSTKGSTEAKELRDFVRGQKDEALLKTLKQTQKESNALRAVADRGCTTCGLPAHLAGVTTLLACQACKKINRNVFYCTKECQVQDWKHGNPTHKSICGNKSALAESVLSPGKAEKDADSGKWGAPDPGFVRSPALLHQLKFLAENPMLDYVIVRPAPEPDQGIKLVNGMGSMFFSLLMKRAVCRDSPRDVVQMFSMLESSAVDAPGGKQGLKRQLFREYNVDIDAVSKVMEQEKKERLEREGKTAEEAQQEIEDMYANLMDKGKSRA